MPNLLVTYGYVGWMNGMLICNKSLALYSYGHQTLMILFKEVWSLTLVKVPNVCLTPYHHWHAISWGPTR